MGVKRVYTVTYKAKNFAITGGHPEIVGKNFSTSILGIDEDEARKNFERFYPHATIVEIRHTNNL
jgi:hypothetical protein